MDTKMVVKSLFRPTPGKEDGISAVNNGHLMRVVTQNGSLVHFVQVYFEDEQRITGAFYDSETRKWWAPDQMAPRISIVTWDGPPPDPAPASREAVTNSGRGGINAEKQV